MTVFWEKYIEFIRDIPKTKYGRISYDGKCNYLSGLIIDVDVYHKDEDVEYIHLIRQLINEMCDFVYDNFNDVNREIMV